MCVSCDHLFTASVVCIRMPIKFNPVHTKVPVACPELQWRTWDAHPAGSQMIAAGLMLVNILGSLVALTTNRCGHWTNKLSCDWLSQGVHALLFISWDSMSDWLCVGPFRPLVGLHIGVRLYCRVFDVCVPCMCACMHWDDSVSDLGRVLSGCVCCQPAGRWQSLDVNQNTTIQRGVQQ